jgi:hypothetical protein
MGEEPEEGRGTTISSCLPLDSEGWNQGREETNPAMPSYHRYHSEQINCPELLPVPACAA